MPGRLPAIDAIKAVASQLIVFHHLAFYGPMSDVVYPSAETIVGWLRTDALIAVAAFLVIGGFLSAHSLLGRSPTAGAPALPVLLWRRYLRLARPYLAALAVAIAFAALARMLISDPDTPHAPTLPQLLAHLFLVQDIFDIEALSAGIWYIAIDFQLFVLFALLIRLSRPLAAASGMDPSRLAVAACALLTLVSLVWFNRDDDLDMWAPYFFGAYGLGILAQRLDSNMDRPRATLLLLAPVAAALAVEWRSRVLLAGCTALALIWSQGGRLAPDWANSRPIAFLGRISYSLFLIHYPVCLLVGSLVHRTWPTSVPMNVAGMIAAWLLSIGAATVLYRLAEAPGRLRPATS